MEPLKDLQHHNESSINNLLVGLIRIKGRLIGAGRQRRGVGGGVEMETGE